MRSKWIWLAVVLAIVIAAFLFPRIILWIEQKNAQDEVLTHGMGTLLNFDALKLSEKQRVLTSGTLTFVEEQGTMEKELLEDFYLEIETLHACGALSNGFYAACVDVFATEAVTSKVWHALDSTGASFRVYTLRAGPVSAYYDAETGKILNLAFYDGSESLLPYEDAEKMDGSLSAGLQAQLRSWAEYYGVRADDFSDTEWNNDIFSMFTQCTMYDSTGGSFSFGTGVSGEDGSIFFGSVPNETEMIQEVE